MLTKFTLNHERVLKMTKMKNVFFVLGFLMMGFALNAQTSINCLYPFVPTPCEGWIDSSPNMVEVTTDCPTGYTLTIGDPVLISGSGSCPGATYSVTYTATDNCGSSSSCSQTWVIQNDGPTLVCPTDLYLTCGDPLNDVHIEEWLGSLETNVSCLLGSNSFNTYNPNWINGPCLSAFQTVSFFVTDACGRSASCSATVFVSDTDAPVIEQPAEDLLAVCSYDTPHDFQDWINNHGGAVASDACSNVSWSTIPANPQLPLACEEIEVTFVARDGCGWEVSTTASFELIDCHPPVITGQPGDRVVECTDDIDAALNAWLGSNGGATAEDACGDVIWMSDPMNPMLSDDCGNTGSVTVVFIAKDNCGNEALTNPATFTVVDNTPPVFTSVPMDMTLDCNDDPVFGTPTAEDACGMVTITHVDVETGGSCDGSATRTWTATDECGNTATASQTINFSDTNPPVFTSVPGDESVECTDDVVFGTPEANDDCGDVTITHMDMTLTAVEGGFSGDQEVPASGSNGSGSVTGTYKASTGKLMIDVSFEGLMDTTAAAHIHNAPVGANGGVVFALPIPTGVTEGGFSYMVELDADQAAEFEAGNYYINIHTPAVPSGEIRAQLFNKTCIGTATRTWTATDECGNTSTASQSIRFEDTEAPIASGTPADITISCGDPIEFGDAPTWTDNCDTDIFTSVEDSTEDADCPNTLTYVRTWAAIDDCGNLGTAKQRIFVEDLEPPVFTYVPPTQDIDCMVPPFNFEEPIAVDNCGGTVTLTFVDEAPNGSICDIGAAFNRAYTATDECGNTATVDVQIWVNADQGGPEFTFVPEDLTFYCADGEPVIPDAVAVDDCDPDVMITFEDEFNTDPDDCGNGYGYDIIRTWTATDHCGNTTTAVTLAWVKGPLSRPAGNVINNGGFISNEGDVLVNNILSISPNPADDNLNVIFTSEVEQNASIRVFDILGKNVLSRVENAVEGTNVANIAVSGFTPGTYLISIGFGDSVITKKFIKR